MTRAHWWWFQSPRRRLAVLLWWLGVAPLLSCTEPVDLPEVRTPLTTDLGCPVSLHGSVAQPAWFEWSDGTDILECAVSEFGACRPGRLDYEVAVSAQGEPKAVSVVGTVPDGVRWCVANHLREAVIAPARDCRQQSVASTFQGSLEWGPPLVCVGPTAPFSGQRGRVLTGTPDRPQ
jgi:hypothetical protein